MVQPYSGTRSSIRISWICKQQFVSYWGKENFQVVESDIEITFNKFKQHKCKGLKLNFWKQPHIDMFNLHILRHNIHMHSETLWRASIHEKVAITHSHFFWNLNGGITKLRCVCNLCPGQTIPKISENIMHKALQTREPKPLILKTGKRVRNLTQRKRHCTGEDGSV